MATHQSLNCTGTICLVREEPHVWFAAICIGKRKGRFDIVALTDSPTVRAGRLTTVSHIVQVCSDDFVLFVGDLTKRYGRVIRKMFSYAEVELYNNANNHLYPDRTTFVRAESTLFGPDIVETFNRMVFDATPSTFVCPVAKELMLDPITVIDCNSGKLGVPMHQFTVNRTTLTGMVKASTCTRFCDPGCTPRNVPAFLAHHKLNPVVNPSLNGIEAVIGPKVLFVEDFALKVEAANIVGPEVSHVTIAAGRSFGSWLTEISKERQSACTAGPRKCVVDTADYTKFVDQCMTEHGS